jgi:hypothetical protein
MGFDRAFFDLQVHFAQHAARIAGVPLDRALFECTNLYVRFGAGRAFDIQHPLWVAYVRGLREHDDVAGWTWHYLQQCPVHLAAPPVLASEGCFSLAQEADGAVRLHFNPQANPPAHTGDSPLCDAAIALRRAELRRLFEQLRERAPEADPLVRGTSWLYNLRAYRQLFPASYLATSQPVARLRALSLWGQFLDRHGCIRVAQAADFTQRLARHVEYATLCNCFALQALAVNARASVFWAHTRANREAT